MLDIRPIQDFEHAIGRFSEIGPLWRRGEVEIQSLHSGVTNEGPVIVEPPAVAVAKVVDDHPPCLAEARRYLE